MKLSIVDKLTISAFMEVLPKIISLWQDDVVKNNKNQTFDEWLLSAREFYKNNKKSIKKIKNK